MTVSSAVGQGHHGNRVPDVQVLGHTVLTQGETLHVARRFVVYGIRAAARDGIAPPPLVIEYLQALTTAVEAGAVMSEVGLGDVAEEPDLPPSEVSEPLTTREVAEMLHIGRRQAQRMGRTLDARQLRSGVWLFDKATVVAYIADRDEVAA